MHPLAARIGKFAMSGMRGLPFLVSAESCSGFGFFLRPTGVLASLQDMATHTLPRSEEEEKGYKCGIAAFRGKLV